MEGNPYRQIEGPTNIPYRSRVKSTQRACYSPRRDNPRFVISAVQWYLPKLHAKRKVRLDLLQRSGKIGNEIVGVFDADGVADEIVFDPDHQAFFGS